MSQEHEDAATPETGVDKRKLSFVGGFVGTVVGARRGLAGAVTGGLVGGTLGYLTGASTGGEVITSDTDPVSIDVSDADEEPAAEGSDEE